jgi:hypothetical protein
VSASAAKRTTAPAWWRPQHDRALLSAVALRGNTPGIKSLVEVGAILKDHALAPLPLAPECEAFVQQRVSAEFAELERMRAHHDRAVKTRNALECSYRSECEAALRLGQDPPQMPMLPLLPPEPPSAADVGSPEEAAARCWAALTQGICKRLSRLLEGVLHPSVTIAAAPARSRGASAERAVVTVAATASTAGGASGFSAAATASSANDSGAPGQQQSKPFDIVALMHRAQAQADAKRAAREAREAAAAAGGGGEGGGREQQQQQQPMEEEKRITLRLASTPPTAAADAAADNTKPRPLPSAAGLLAAGAERLAAAAGLPPSAALAARAGAAAAAFSPPPRRSPRGGAAAASSPAAGAGAGAAAPSAPPTSSKKRKQQSQRPSSSPPAQEQRDPNSDATAAAPAAAPPPRPSVGKAAAVSLKRPLPPAVAAALMFKQTTLSGTFSRK